MPSDFQRQLQGYGLTTAKVLYYLPDHRGILAPPFVWQEYDKYPEFPRLDTFLRFWQKSIEGPLHSVLVAHSRLIKPAEIRAIGAELRLH